MIVSNLLKLSRPRFWFYLAGPYLIGYASGAPTLASFIRPQCILYLLFFLIPANICLYGIESLHLHAITRGTKRQRKIFFLYFGFSILSALVAIGAEPSYTVKLLTAIYILSTVFYSIPSIRYKARHFVDFGSSIPFVIPGMMGYLLAAERLPSAGIPIATFFLFTGIHVLSSLAKPGVYRHGWFVRSAIILGKRKALLVSAGCLSLAAGMMVFSRILIPWSFLITIYPLLPLFLVFRPKVSIWEITRFLPDVNTGAMILTALLIITSKPLS